MAGTGSPLSNLSIHIASVRLVRRIWPSGLLERLIGENTDPRILSELSLLNADLATERAVKLRDQGDFAGAQRELRKNAERLDKDH